MVFATKEQIAEALDAMEKVFGKEARRFLKDTFASNGDTVEFEGKKYIRVVDTTYSENWEYRAEEDETWDIIKKFFNLIGPVSHIEEY